MKTFEVDLFYEYGMAKVHGTFNYLPIHTPGHTPSTTSYFYEDGDFCVDFHGSTSMKPFRFLISCKVDAPYERAIYRMNMEKLPGIFVDFTVTNYVENIPILRRIKEDKMDILSFCERWPLKVSSARKIGQVFANGSR